MAAATTDRRTRDEIVDALVDHVAVLAAENVALRRRVEALERRHARDAEDTRLLVELARATNGASFRTPWLMDLALVDTALADALRAATIQSSRELGCTLRRLRGCHDDILVERLTDQRWRIAYYMPT